MIQLAENRLTERDLMRRVGRRLQVCDCDCGGQVVATADDWDDVAEALRSHQQGERHSAYRERMGFVEAWL